MKKIAFITGITGQDGSYLAEFLLKKNYIRWIVWDFVIIQTQNVVTNTQQ